MQDGKSTGSRKIARISLGSNLSTVTNTPVETLTEALRLLCSESALCAAQSSWYGSPAFPAGSGPDFVNAVVQVETTLTADQLLAELHRIETGLGRVRKARWGARVCDLDLLDYDGQVLPDLATYSNWRDLPFDAQTTQTPDRLILPHPRIQDRAFVLKPLAEIAPDWRHPVSGKTVQELLAQLPQDLRDCVRKIDVN